MKSLSKLSRLGLMALFALALSVLLMPGCQSNKPANLSASGDAASKVYVAPGEYDELYMFASGGFSGQMSVYGLPSGRMLKVIPVFSQNPENGYGYSEETKDMLRTSYGLIPWGDAHHPTLSKTGGDADGRWIFINENNTPRIARISLTTFTTDEIIELPNSSGNHPSPYPTENTEYVFAGTRFSVPIGANADVPINTFKENFKGMISFVKVEPSNGRMSLAAQVMVPPFDFDLCRAGKGVSRDWTFMTCYNSEMAFTMKEAFASQNDKDYIIALNWKKMEEYLQQGKFTEWNTPYYHNYKDHKTHMTVSTEMKSQKVMDPKDCPGMVFLIPCPKSPHGVDVSPTGEYIVASGKLAALIPVFSYEKMIKAIENKAFDGEIDGIPILKYEEVIAGEVQQPGLGPLHTEFDDKGYGYTSMFLSSEIVKWKLGTWEVVDRVPAYYSIGHLLIPEGDSKNPYGKYAVALNKITKDRYLPTGPELTHSAQLIDISGDKMKMLLDFPTIGEPHYAQAISAKKVMPNSAKIYKLEDNQHPHAIKNEKEARVVREGNIVRIYATTIRSHFAPDNIEGIQVGDKVYWHITNLEQDWDVPHGFAVQGATNAELLIMPGETATLLWEPTRPGVHSFYCTDFCSALHQEMQGYIRVSPANSNVPLKWSLGEI